MIEPIRKTLRRWRNDRQFRRKTANLPDYLLRDLGLEYDRVGATLMRHVLHPGR
jgi:uncharacterized protein YjiS (DUF1127 family)